MSTSSATAGRALRTAILADASVSAIIGTRMYPLVRPQGTALPAIVYRQTHRPEHYISGEVGLSYFDVELDLMYEQGTSAYEDLHFLVGKVRAVLDTMPGNTYATVGIQRCQVQSVSDAAVSPNDASERFIFIATIEVLVAATSVE